MSICKCDGADVIVFDSTYSSLNKITKTLLARLVNSRQRVINVKVAKTVKQSGTSDCGVFAVAYATSLAFGQDPSSFAKAD